MWLYILLTVGAVGLAVVTLLTRLRPKCPPKTELAQPLVHLSPSEWQETSPGLPKERRWSPITIGRRDRLTRDARFLHHIAQLINSASSLDSTLSQVIGGLTEHLAMDMGRVFLLDENEMLQLAISVGSSARQNGLPNWEYTLPDLVLAADKLLVTPDLRRWPHLRAFISATDLASTLWLPLKAGGRSVGALGLGSCRPSAFDKPTVAMVETVASYLATTVENFRLRRRVVQEKELRQTLQRYVSPRLVPTFRRDSAPHPQEIIDASRRMSVLFADVRSFTRLMETADPDAVMLVLNEYFLRMSQIIQANGGVVDEFAGDQIVASFDRASPGINDAYRAVRAGLEMLDGLNLLQERWQKRGLPTFDIGVGISTGAVTRGSIGSTERRALIALGSILNIASRAEAMNKEFGTHLIITQSTFEQVADLIEYDALGAHELQGISEPVPLYSVRGMRNNHLPEIKTSNATPRITQVTQHRQAIAERSMSRVGTGVLS